MILTLQKFSQVLFNKCSKKGTVVIKVLKQHRSFKTNCTFFLVLFTSVKKQEKGTGPGYWHSLKASSRTGMYVVCSEDG